MNPLVWSVLCTILMILMIVIEMLTPSFGFFTTGAVAFLVASCVMAFRESSTSGYIMTGINLALFPVAVYFAMQLMKRSPLALNHEIVAGVPPETQVPEAPHELVGKEGTSVTMLRPSGTAQFGDRRLQVVTEGKYVEAGKPVKVLKVEGSNVVVEPLA